MDKKSDLACLLFIMGFYVLLYFASIETRPVIFKISDSTDKVPETKTTVKPPLVDWECEMIQPGIGLNCETNQLRLPTVKYERDPNNPNELKVIFIMKPEERSDK